MRWYKKTWVIVVFVVCFFPLGIFFIWKYTNWKQTNKVLVSIVTGVLFVASITQGILEECEKQNSAKKTEQQKQDEVNKKEQAIQEYRQRRKKKLKEWNEYLQNGTFQRIINKCAKVPSEYTGTVSRKEISGPVVILRDSSNMVYLPKNTVPNTYKRPVKNVKYAFLYNTYDYQQEGLYNENKKNVLIFAEYVGIMYVGTYEKIGDVYERVSRIYVIDMDSEELIVFHETGIATGMLNNPPSELSTSYESKKKASDGRLYIDTYPYITHNDIYDSDILHINRFFKLILSE